MGYYINQSGDYYEGDRIGFDNEISKRPDAKHTWNGTAWFADPRTVANAPIDAQIVKLEDLQEQLLTPRAKRELYLGIITALGLDPAINPGTNALATIQAQIVALRKTRQA